MLFTKEELKFLQITLLKERDRLNGDIDRFSKIEELRDHVKTLRGYLKTCEAVYQKTWVESGE